MLRRLAACLLVLAVGGQAVAQPEPWDHPDGSIHYYSAVADSDGITWPAALDSAERLGGYLASLTSPAENDFVFGLVNSKPYWFKRPGSGLWAGPWLGGRQQVGAPEPDSGWGWVSGEPFSLVNWFPGQPNNQDNQNVLHFGGCPDSWVSTWNDLSETDSAIRGFVAEFSAETTTIGLLQNNRDASAGYSLFEPDCARIIFLIDNQGRFVHSWYSPFRAAWSNYLLEDGSLLHTGYLGNAHFQAGGAGGRVSRLAWDGELVWAFEYSNDDHCQHHDIRPLPDGNILIIAWEKKTQAEALAAGRDPSKLWGDELWPDHVIEVDPASDSIVWEWHVWDHLIQDYDPTKANYGVVADHPELVDINYVRTYWADWMHTNAVDYNPDLDQILLSVRELGEVWVIDHSTTTEEAQGHTGGRCGKGGDLLYRWGNPQVYRAGGTTDRRLFGQHDARWVEYGLPGAGNITVFNNGVDRPGDDFSSVDEFIPACDSAGNYPRPAPGAPFAPAAPYWTYTATPPTRFYTEYMGGAHRLPNGNTLVCESDSGHFFEVTPDKQVAWRYLNPVTDSIRLFQGDTVPTGTWARLNSSFRVTRYAPDYPGLLGRDLTPGLPIERYAPPYLGLAETGDPPARPRLSISPNPFRGSVRIRLDHAPSSPGRVAVNTGMLEHAAVTIFDASGRLVRTLTPSLSLTTSPWSLSWNGRDASGRLCPPGVYLCRLNAPGIAAASKVLIAE